MLYLLARNADRLMLQVRSSTFWTLLDAASPPFPVAGRLDLPLRVEWSGSHPDPPTGASRVFGYRWSLDPDTLLAPGPNHDPSSWSEWSTALLRHDLAPMRGDAARRPHRFVIEVMDEVGFYGRAILMLHPLTPSRDRELLVVNDTRFRPDRASHLPIAGSPWPWAAELDTFLFARGGMPWRFYPEGTLSTPGIFAGYDFDTVGTRTGVVDLSVSLEVLSRYRCVVWITDGVAASNYGNGTSAAPMSSLEYMTWAQLHPLDEYVRGGGQLWLVGGGAATAAMRLYNRVQNDLGGPVYSSGYELFPGLLMVDHVRWRGEFRTGRPPIQTIERGGDFLGSGALNGADPSRLPGRLELRAPDSDPIPPEREAVPSSFYIVARPYLEWISRPTHVRSDPIDSTGTVRKAQLDTLMMATIGAPDPGVRPCMTVASGPAGGRVIFSGFDLWSWRRSQCVQVVDAVLGGIWGLPRQPLPAPRPAQRPAAGSRAIIPSSRALTAGHSVSSTE